MGIGVVGQGDSTEGGTRPPLEVVDVYGNMGSREQYKTSVQKNRTRPSSSSDMTLSNKSMEPECDKII